MHDLQSDSEDVDLRDICAPSEDEEYEQHEDDGDSVHSGLCGGVNNPCSD